MPYTEHHVTHHGRDEQQPTDEQTAKQRQSLSMTLPLLVVQRTMPVVILDQLPNTSKLGKVIAFNCVQVLKRVVAHPNDFTTRKP